MAENGTTSPQQTEEQQHNGTPNAQTLNVPQDVDEETLRIMVSTDNHLGYAERDPIRGNDSFAAFEEVLILSKHYNVRMRL